MKLIYKIIAGCFFWLCFVLAGTMPVYGAEPVVVVLDPGHGGKNLGAEYNGYTEKDMTMIVATAMKEELEKYEGVEVYLTRDVDKDMSLEERAEFAASKNADFLFCLHFNMSLGHELFGSEVCGRAAGSLSLRLGQNPPPLCGGWAFALATLQAPLRGYPPRFWAVTLRALRDGG